MAVRASDIGEIDPMHTVDQGLSELEKLVSQATQKLLKDYPWIEISYRMQMESSDPLPLGETLSLILTERFNQFVKEDTSGGLYICSDKLPDGEKPESLTVTAQANVLAGRLQHGVSGEFPGWGGCQLRYSRPLA